MTELRIANAPCSWGVMQGFAAEGSFPPFEQVLDEIALAGYTGTELGDWGFLPTHAESLAPELSQRQLALVAALVPLALADDSTHEGGVAIALRTARLLASCARNGSEKPFVILADNNGADPTRTAYAGRIQREHGWNPAQWRDFSKGAELVARAVLEETGLRTVFHHHCAGFVETADEMDVFVDLTDPGLIGLCFDTGHYAYAGGDVVQGLRRFGDRVWHVHFKDCHARIAEKARLQGWDYFTAVRNGVFYGLGEGEIDFEAVLAELRRRGYTGWIVVEDELPPGMGDPLESARRDRSYLRALGI